MNKVSILIPCYNAERWLKQCIESALNQTYPHNEVIVVDDGSTDNSLEIIKSFGESIKWETGKNQGGNVARNRLLDLSTGEWLQYLDVDDYLFPDKIEQQLKFIEQNPETDIVYSPSILEQVKEKDSYQEILPIPEPHDPWILLARWYLPQTGSPLWKKQAIIDVGGWKVDQPCCQEHELYFRLLKANKIFTYYEKAGAVYRQWSDSTVCKKDIKTTYKYRLEITDLVESYLQSINQLTFERLVAINQSRFDCARLILLFDRDWGRKIMNRVTKTSNSNHLAKLKMPKFYRWLYNIGGFELAEHMACLKRKMEFLLSALGKNI